MNTFIALYIFAFQCLIILYCAHDIMKAWQRYKRSKKEDRSRRSKMFISGFCFAYYINPINCNVYREFTNAPEKDARGRILWHTFPLPPPQ